MKDQNSPRSTAPATISLRLTPEERAELTQNAGKHSLSSYIRSRLFGGQTQAPTKSAVPERVSARERQKLLAQILARLGESSLSRSMADIADAARIGILPATPAVLAEVRGACEDIRTLRTALLRALGLKPAGEVPHDPQG